MRLATVGGRAQLVRPAAASDESIGGRFDLAPTATTTDIATASDHRFGPSMEALLAEWDAFTSWAAAAGDIPSSGTYNAQSADPVVRHPTQVFAVGLNYRAHAAESGAALPEVPLVFTKFPSCIAPPFGSVGVFTPAVDWEVEVAVVVGRGGFRIPRDQAWDHLAGVTAAQDYSARDTQFASKSNPQFNLGKSYPGFLPLGPVLVTPDEFDDPNAIGLSCTVNGVLRQSSSTSDLIFSVPECVEYISGICELRPGDVILTGTPAGVGMGFSPPIYLSPGDEVVTRVDLVGEMRQRCVEAPA
ncbi:MAG: fumarylacetoacetate hydrolase family protein [Frankiaceae bacterium]|nr:fumarylacetoacetate hydrolase family protein [Frankiaceae bacterium]